MKEFVTAVTAAEDQEDNEEGWVYFKCDGVECKARRPGPGQVAYLTASMHKRAPLDQRISGAINFCMSIMDDDSASLMSEKLLDMDDPFGLTELQDIVEWLVEEWAGRPTEASSSSSATARSTTRSSTQSRKKTPSRAGSTAT